MARFASKGSLSDIFHDLAGPGEVGGCEGHGGPDASVLDKAFAFTRVFAKRPHRVGASLTQRGVSEVKQWSDPIFAERKTGVRTKVYEFSVEVARLNDPPEAEDTAMLKGAAMQTATMRSSTTMKSTFTCKPTSRMRHGVYRDDGKHPLSRGHLWPCLTGSGNRPVLAEEVPALTAIEPTASNDFFMGREKPKTAAKTRDCFILGGNVTTDALQSCLKKDGVSQRKVRNAGGQNVPAFRAGSPRPRILERTFQPIVDQSGAVKSATAVTVNFSAGLRGGPPVSRKRLQMVELFATKQKVATSTAVKQSTVAEENVPSSKMREVKAAVKDTLSRVRSRQTKNTRLRAIRALRKKDVANHGRFGNRDRVSNDQLALASACFSRNFKPDNRGIGVFNIETVTEALADFGICATTRPMKLSLISVFSDYAHGEQFNFGHFCTMIEDARMKIRPTVAPTLFQAWRNVDSAQEGMLPPPMLLDLLEEMGMLPTGQAEMDTVEVMIEELRVDESGLVSFHEAELLIQQLREANMSKKRQQELEIQATYGIPDTLFLQFRSHMIKLHSEFNSLLHEDNGKYGISLGTVWNQLHEDNEFAEEMKVENVYYLLKDLGVTAHCAEEEKTERTAEIVLDYCCDRGAHFSDFLGIIAQQRYANAEDMREFVQELFKQYDTDRSGSLETSEMCLLLVQLNLQPRTPQEQTEIAEIMLEADGDGSGHIEMEELLTMMQRIQERLTHILRTLEIEKCEALGFSRRRIHQLRAAFDTLDPQASGSLNLTQIEHALQLMKWHTTKKKLDKLLLDADDDGSGTLEFLEFMALMKAIEEDIFADSIAAEDKEKKEPVLRNAGRELTPLQQKRASLKIQDK